MIFASQGQSAEAERIDFVLSNSEEWQVLVFFEAVERKPFTRRGCYFLRMVEERIRVSLPINLNSCRETRHRVSFNSDTGYS